MAAEEKSGRGFTIVDRRGDKGEETPDQPSEQATEAPKPEPAGVPQTEPESEPAEARKPDPAPAEGPGAHTELPAIDFSTFTLSLGTSALYHMGLVGDPQSGERVAEPNLLLARQTIDTLTMLETKTRGNLDPEEARLLEGLLYELRMRFVEVAK